MAARDELDGLYEHLERSARMGREESRRLVTEVVAYFGESLEQFVRRRHGELQAEDHRNPVIFDQIAAELAQRRFAAPAVSARQIRRLIYG